MKTYEETRDEGLEFADRLIGSGDVDQRQMLCQAYITGICNGRLEALNEINATLVIEKAKIT